MLDLSIFIALHIVELNFMHRLIPDAVKPGVKENQQKELTERQETALIDSRWSEMVSLRGSRLTQILTGVPLYIL